MATGPSVEVPNGESHSGAVQKRNSSEGSIEAYPYANEDTNETIEGKKNQYDFAYLVRLRESGLILSLKICNYSYSQNQILSSPK